MKYVITQAGDILEFPDNYILFYQNHPDWIMETQDQEVAERISGTLKRLHERERELPPNSMNPKMPLGVKIILAGLLIYTIYYLITFN